MSKFVVDVTCESRFPVDRKRIRQVVERVLVGHHVEGPVAVSVGVVGDRKMATLNQKYRNIEGPTDVLSFSTEESQDKKGKAFVYPDSEPFPLGDVVISYPQARTQAVEDNVLVNDRIEALLEHGVKSLLGMHPES